MKKHWLITFHHWDHLTQMMEEGLFWQGFRDHSNTAEGIVKCCRSHEDTSGRREKGNAVHSSFLYFLSSSSCGMRSPTLRVYFSPSVNSTLRPAQMCLVTHTDVPHQRRLHITPTFPSYQTFLPDAQPREQPLPMTNRSLKCNPNVTLCSLIFSLASAWPLITSKRSVNVAEVPLYR